jgi:site-specific recombinase XerD
MEITNENQPAWEASREELDGHLARFLEQLKQERYTAYTIEAYGKYLTAFCVWLAQSRTRLSEMDEHRAVELFRPEDQPPYKVKHQRFMVRRFMRFLVGLKLAAPPPEIAPRDPVRLRIKQNYEEYLSRQRGLSGRTIYHSWRLADRLLNFRFGKKVGDLAEITANDVAAFLQEAVGSKKHPFRDKTLSSHLRNFLRYLFKIGATPANLSLGVPSVAQRRGSRLPRHLRLEDVERVLQAVLADTTTGKRNHAMVLLIARLGLRASEVVRIQIDDIDWRNGGILVRGKGESHDRVPLPPDVGEALAHYVQFERKTSSRALFVQKRPPNAPFKDGQVLNNILTRAFKRTGVKPPAPYIGSHILRHSLATNLVQRGASLQEIGDMLRHRSQTSTMLYAKLDVDGLRSIAKPWPVAGGVR